MTIIQRTEAAVGPRPETTFARNLLPLSSFSALALATLFLFGCQTKNNQPQPAGAPPAKSAIGVSTSASEITVRTPTAEFTLLPSGAFSAKLSKATESVTLDTNTAEPAQSVTIAKKNFATVDLDLASVRIQDAAGKLGSLGKQITVMGKVPGTDL